MKLDLQLATFEGDVLDPTLSLIGYYLLHDAPSFGTAIEDVEVRVHLRSGPPDTTVAESDSLWFARQQQELRETFDRFHVRQRTLPLVTFHRHRRWARIQFASELLSGEEAHNYSPLRVDFFNAGCVVVAEHLQRLGTRLTESDDFDQDAFRFWLNERLTELPKQATELKALLEAKTRALHAEQGDPWEELEVDFAQFHPDARKLLPDVALWDEYDHDCPHAFPLGSELLVGYREWRAKNKEDDPLRFFEQHTQLLGLPNPRNREERKYVHELIIALAFAELKVLGCCDKEVARRALEAIQQRRVNRLTEWMTSVLARYS